MSRPQSPFEFDEDKIASPAKCAGWAAIVILVGISCGCYEKPVAPQIEYATDDVQVLREEIDKMEWD